MITVHCFLGGVIALELSIDYSSKKLFLNTFLVKNGILLFPKLFRIEFRVENVSKSSFFEANSEFQKIWQIFDDFEMVVSFERTEIQTLFLTYIQA